MEATCPNCRLSYTRFKHRNGQVKLYCSNKCRAQFHKDTRRTCAVCGNESTNVLPHTISVDGVPCYVCVVCFNMELAAPYAKERTDENVYMHSAHRVAWETFRLGHDVKGLAPDDLLSDKFVPEAVIQEHERRMRGLRKVARILQMPERVAKRSRDPELVAAMRKNSA